MHEKNIAIAYYTAFGEKNLAALEQYLHPDIEFITPLMEVRGREAYLEATKHYMNFFISLAIREAFGYAGRALLVFDYEFPVPLGHVPAAMLITFKEERIAKMELFVDGSLFVEKKEEIFK